MAQQESFDPKPYAPLEYRGSFGVVKTKLPGEVFCEMWPATAGVADKLCVVRSMSHGEAAHERGTHNMFTGYRPSPAIQYPSLGSIVSHELGSRADLPAYVCVPNMPNPYAGTGYLSSSYGPFSLGADPAQGGFRVRDLALPNGVDAARFTRRRTAMDAVNAHFEAVEKADAIGAMDTFYQQAYNLISSAKAREAFNLDAEPAAIRDEYGRNEAGARLLMARRLIAAGVRVVSVTYGGWDFHREIVPATRNEAPPLDRAFAALIRDLDRTGLLDSTIVMLSSEFGRTPKINGDRGRDHWPRVFSIALAGGGIAGARFSAPRRPPRPSPMRRRSVRPTCSPRCIICWESITRSGCWPPATGRLTSFATASCGRGCWDEGNCSSFPGAELSAEVSNHASCL